MSVGVSHQHAEILLRDCCDQAQRDHLHNDPLAAVCAWPGVRVVFRDEPAKRSGCGIDGFYDDGVDPPHITITRSLSERRQAFTALHELAHHLVRDHVELADRLWRTPRGEELEERICHAFASLVIFSDDLLETVFEAPEPTAQQVVALFGRSHGSREACCVAASLRLRQRGYVVLADLNGTVRFAADAHTIYPLARGTTQDDQLLRDAVNRGRARGATTLRFPSGATTPELRGDAARDGDYLFLVAVEGQPPWGHAWDAPARQRPGEPEHTCDHCGHTWQQWEERCRDCGLPPCPMCGRRCGCRSGARERLCPACGLMTAAFAPGSAICRDCD